MEPMLPFDFFSDTRLRLREEPLRRRRPLAAEVSQLRL